MTTEFTATVPDLSLDLYGDDVLGDSREAFAHMRATLRDDAVYRSGAGVAANGLSNRLGRDTTLAKRVEAVEVAAPERLRNNTLHGIAGLPARFLPA